MASIDLSVHLSAFQRQILSEARNVGNGTLWVPMGSGKTRISLYLAWLYSQDCLSNPSLPRQKSYPSLFIVAKSLISEWVTEIERVFGDSVKYKVLHQDLCKNVMQCESLEYDFVITTPEVITKHYTTDKLEDVCIKKIVVQNGHLQYEKLQYNRPEKPFVANNPLYGIMWSTVIVDEAQKYLNPTTTRTRAIIAVCAKHRWLLSGTIFSEPKPLNIFGYYLLINHQKTPRTKPDFDLYYKSSDYTGAEETLVIRDKNDDYIPEDLGQTINYEIVSHSLMKEEMDFYLSIKTIIGIIYNELQSYKLNKEKSKELKNDIKKLRGTLLSMVQYLRQAIACPMIPLTSMYIGLSSLSERDDLTDSFTRELLKTVGDWVQKEESVLSSRFRKALELVNKHNEKRIVVFSDYRTVLDVFEHYVKDKRPVYTISGNMSVAKRSKVIEEWETSENAILLLTYAIGSCGLNLQKGQVVITLDYGWDIDVTKQAVARVVRRGQQASSVHIYYLTSNTGIEKSIYDIHQSKKEQCEDVIKGTKKAETKGISLKDVIKFIDMEDNCKVLQSML